MSNFKHGYTSGQNIVLESLSQVSACGVERGIGDYLEEHWGFACKPQCSRVVTIEGHGELPVQIPAFSAVFLSSLCIMSPL
jgi:hypothetical protein